MVGNRRNPLYRIAIITIHGTSEGEANGSRWWEPGSTFASSLLRRLQSAGVTADIKPYLWSGANKALDREAGGEKLVPVIRMLRRSYESVHIVAFSHGGTVANFAADDLRWGRRWFGKDALSSITTVGTPFFRVSASWTTIASNVLFLLATLMGLVGGVVFMLANSDPDYGIRALIIASAAFTLYLAWQIARQGLRRALRPRRPGGKRQALAIWHPNDEVISGLRNLEALPIEPFGRWTLLRGAHNTASLVGLVAMLVPLAAAVYLFFPPGDPGPVLSILLTVLLLPFIPVYYVSGYLIYRIIVGGTLEFLLRGRLNKWISSIVRGMAFGKDHEQAVGLCQPTSHSLHTVQHRLEGPIARRMQTNAAETASKLLERHRWAFFSAEGDALTNVQAIIEDAMTWNSLIHTTYFDQPEIADIIGDYIVGEAKKARGG